MSSDGLSLGDFTDALTIGDSNDLSLYHASGNATIKNDTGDLTVRSDSFRVKNNANNEEMFSAYANGAVTLFHNNSAKLTTTSTGIDVTGTVTSDGLTVDGSATFTTADNSAQITLVSTDTDALVGPQLNLWRNSGTGTNGDLIGQITFTGEDTVGATNTFATISAVAEQTNNGAEDGALHFKTLLNGTLANRLSIGTGSSGGDISFYEDTGTTAKFFWDASAESLGIGTSSPAQKLTVGAGGRLRLNRADNTRYGDMYVNNDFLNIETSNDPIKLSSISYTRFDVSGSERMRIDSSGNLLVGTSSANAKIYALNNSGTGATSIRADNNSNNYTAHHFWSILGGTGNDNTTAIHMAGYTNVGNRFVIYGNGNMVNSNNSYGALSDLKLKENIINASSQWDDIKALTIRKYSMKEDNLDSPNKLGVIAQELEAAGMGGLVYESPDRDSDGEILDTTTKQVNYSILYMKAVKALQEAMIRIETLETRLTALEG